MSGGEGVNFLQAPTSFPQAPSYFKHSQKDVEGGGPGKKDVGPPHEFPLKRDHVFYKLVGAYANVGFYTISPLKQTWGPKRR